MEAGWAKADLHVHTRLGDGMADIPDLLRYVAEHTDLDIVAITDHDDLEGGLRARDLAQRMGYPFEVIPGMEVTTREGHLLALFLERPVRSFQRLLPTLEAVHAQGGICIAPHPMSWLTHSIGRGTLRKLMHSGGNGYALDGLEVANPTIAGRVTADQVRTFNQAGPQTAVTGGSDAHFLPLVGTGYTLFRGRTSTDLREAIVARATVARHVEVSHLRTVGYGPLAAQQFRSLVVMPLRFLARSVTRGMGSPSL